MIEQLVFTVTGKTYVDDDLIFTSRLEFVTTGEATLVILPKKGAPPGAQRMLKIVADVVDASLAPGVAEITYNLDGDITLPLIDNGLDPETPPLISNIGKTGGKGNPDFFLGPLNPASPNFPPLIDTGAFPKATAGGDGAAGGKGGTGVMGGNAPILEIWTKKIVGDIEIDLRGQRGGDGGQGGAGQFGGQGQVGSPGVVGADSNWIGIPSVVCKQAPGMGGDGGRGGNAGCGGDGGDGGNGGVLKVFFVAGADLTKLHPELQGGKGGQVGPTGAVGKGGGAGANGLDLAQCTSPLGAQNGPDGSPCRQDTGKEGGGISKPGVDGKDGQYYQYQVTTLPHVPGIY
ncbi:MAG: hypothetical protein OK455_03220 [Thaumarchaeota archaeon]|nr:hypothetical protein [Nitrososphaerota archaeon]